MKQQLKESEEQRVQSLTIQRDTNKAFDRNMERIEVEKQNIFQQLDVYLSSFQNKEEPDNLVSTKEENSSATGRLAEQDEDDEKIAIQEVPNRDNNDTESKSSPRKTEVRKYRTMFERETKVSLDLREKVKGLKLKNKNGAKALRILVKNNSELEARVKSLKNLCGQMNKFHQNLIQVLEHELELLIQKVAGDENLRSCQELQPKIAKLRSGLQTEEILLRELYKEGESSEYLEFGSGIGNCLRHLQTLKKTIDDRLSRPVLKKHFSANDVQTMKSYDICSPVCKTIKS